MLENDEFIGNECINAFSVVRWFIFLLDTCKTRILVDGDFTEEYLNLTTKIIELGL